MVFSYDGQLARVRDTWQLHNALLKELDSYHRQRASQVANPKAEPDPESEPATLFPLLPFTPVPVIPLDALEVVVFDPLTDESFDPEGVFEPPTVVPVVPEDEPLVPEDTELSLVWPDTMVVPAPTEPPFDSEEEEEEDEPTAVVLEDWSLLPTTTSDDDNAELPAPLFAVLLPTP